MNILNKFVIRNFKKNKARTIVTIMGIIIAVSMITAVFVFVSSIQHQSVEEAKENSGDYYGIYKNLPKERLESDERVEKIGVCETQKVILPREGSLFKQYDGYSHMVYIDQSLMEMLNSKIVAGRMAEREGEIVVEKSMMSYMPSGLSLGDKVKVKEGKVTEYERFGMVSDTEKITDVQEKEYKIVGICEDFYASPEALILVPKGEKPAKTSYTFVKTKTLNDIYDISTEYSQVESFEYNDYILLYLGGETFFKSPFFPIGVIFVFLIMIGAITLIYNAFNIALQERRKAMGVFSSIGATGKQLKHIVFKEALYMGLIGVPIGILAGVGGISLTIHLMGKEISLTYGGEEFTDLGVHISFQVILTAVIVSIVAIGISAYIPARKSAKLNPIGAIRKEGHKNQDSPFKLKSTKRTRNISFETMLAFKNFSSAKRRFRGSIISITISMSFFVLATSLGNYLFLTNDMNTLEETYQIIYWSNISEEISGHKKLEEAKSVKDSTYVKLFLYEEIAIDVMPDRKYKEYLEKNNIYKEKKSVSTEPYSEDSFSWGNYANFPIEGKATTMAVGAEFYMLPTIVTSESHFEKYFAKQVQGEGIILRLFETENVKEAREELENICIREGAKTENIIISTYISNFNKSDEKIFNIFVYGFITLISLMSLANVFNAISENIISRKRDFATLKALGISKKSFRRVLMRESFLLGIKTILIGIPTSVIVTGVILYNIYFNWYSIRALSIGGMIIAILSIFIAIFTITLYTGEKVGRENIMGILKNDNI